MMENTRQSLRDLDFREKQERDRREGPIVDYKEWRQFDPLKPINPATRQPHCILHVATHVESHARNKNSSQYHDTSGHLEDFLVTKRCIESLQDQTISNQNGFKLELIISINGYITEPKYIEWFEFVNESWLNDKIYCRVFQRPNFGYHWSGFHDVWMRYKETACAFWASLECDHVFMYDDWFDQLKAQFTTRPEIGLFGKYQNPQTVDPERAFGTIIPPRMWRNSDGKPFENPTNDIMIHTCGAFCMLKREVLQKMDDKFGCFTFGMGIHHTIDGIICGEIGICQKTRALGYDIKGKPLKFLVRPIRGADRWPAEWAKYLEMRKEWGPE